MRAIDVLTNLKNFDCWEFKGYSLSKEEANICIAALENLEKNKDKDKESKEATAL